MKFYAKVDEDGRIVQVMSVHDNVDPPEDHVEIPFMADPSMHYMRGRTVFAYTDEERARMLQRPKEHARWNAATKQWHPAPKPDFPPRNE